MSHSEERNRLNRIRFLKASSNRILAGTCESLRFTGCRKARTRTPGFTQFTSLTTRHRCFAIHGVIRLLLVASAKLTVANIEWHWFWRVFPLRDAFEVS